MANIMFLLFSIPVDCNTFCTETHCSCSLPASEKLAEGFKASNDAMSKKELLLDEDRTTDSIGGDLDCASAEKGKRHDKCFMELIYRRKVARNAYLDAQQ